jgi:hypothetical protein
MAVWYKLNVIDYVKAGGLTIKAEDVIKNLLCSESFVSSVHYNQRNKNAVNQAYLRSPWIKRYFGLRNLAERFLKQK